MVRVLIKGGVWKNTEDEILKAAVMKYGKNQWARISSLLTRKTPKQCKARWFEWLDPSVKKTDWNKHEDEKLLHLAKLMPTQWRTIAPVVGRTPAQCLERYHRLLDEADLNEDQGPNSDDVRRLRPGEIDPDPESKPARPDPVDMDEDEKEMLSEARARLANTQGKKAKRKAREKQMEESRRLAALQKRRELKAAGIDVKIETKKRNDKTTTMDYNTNIPFHHIQPSGFFDVNAEIAREKAEKKDMINSLLSTLDGKRRMEIEDSERKRDFKRQKSTKENEDFVPPAALKASTELAMSDRKRLVLPAPQVSESELEELVKLGVSGEAARLMAESGGETPSASLIGDGFGTVHTNVPMRTPRTVSSGDVLKQQARNLRAMTESQTPLLGGDIYIEGNVGFESTTPNILSKIPKATPNPLLSNLTPSLASGSTPFGMTPLRDNMSINTPAIHSVHGFDETPRSVKGNAIQSRLHLQSMFKSLPKAKNDFEIVIPEIEEDDTVESTETIQPDSDDVKAALNLQKEKKKKEEFLRMSLVVQRNLPRPVVTQELFEMLTNDPGSTVESLINMQVGLLVYEDCVRFPIDGQQSIVNSLNSFEILDDVYLHEADTLIKNETTNIPEIEIESKSFDSLFEYIPATCTKSASFLEIGKLAKDHRTQTLLYSAQFSKLEQEMKSLAGKCSKLEKKQNILFGKHYTISTSLRARIFEMGSILEAGVTELEELKLVYENEISIVELRIGDVSKWLEKLSLLEQDLQDEYRRLSNNDHAI